MSEDLPRYREECFHGTDLAPGHKEPYAAFRARVLEYVNWLLSKGVRRDCIEQDAVALPDGHVWITVRYYYSAELSLKKMSEEAASDAESQPDK